MELSQAERATLRLLADTIVPRAGDPKEPLGGSASDNGIDALMAQAIRDYQPPDVQKDFLTLLRAVESPVMNLGAELEPPCRDGRGHRGRGIDLRGSPPVHTLRGGAVGEEGGDKRLADRPRQTVAAGRLLSRSS